MIRIIHAYPDLLNLYGDYANIMLLEKRLGAAGATVETDRFEIGEDIDIKDADLIYFGCATENKMLTAARDLGRMKDDIAEYLSNGGKIFFCGASSALALESITDLDGKITDGLGFVGGSAIIHGKRYYSEIVAKSDFCKDKILGFFNSSMRIEASANPLWRVECDSAGLVGDAEGYRSGNIFATQLCGPLFYRNPSLLTAVAEALTGETLPECSDRIFTELEQGYIHAAKVMTE